MDRPKQEIELLCDRMTAVIENYGGKPPKANEAGSLTLIADFCWALDVKPVITLQPK